MLQPLGDRVLIKPEKPRDRTDSGLHLIEHWPQETMGEVIALGTQTSPFRHIAHDLARRLDKAKLWFKPQSAVISTLDELLQDAATMLRDLTPEIPLKVGDTVLFSADVGQTLTVEGDTVLMMRVSDVLCVVDWEAVA